MGENFSTARRKSQEQFLSPQNLHIFFTNPKTPGFQQVFNTPGFLTSFQQFPGRVWPQNFTTCASGLSRTFFVSTQFSQLAHFPKMCRLCVGRPQLLTPGSQRETI